MTYPMPDPNPHPTGRHGPREMAVGSALYGRRRVHKPCPQCGDTDCCGDERWQHERDYRGSETYWMEVARR